MSPVRGRRPKYPLHDMLSGESRVVPCEPGTETRTRELIVKAITNYRTRGGFNEYTATRGTAQVTITRVS